MLLNFFNIIVFAPLIFALGKTRVYARIHMLFAVAVWSMEYIVIDLFHSPVGVAIVSVFLAIFTIVIFMLYISKLIKVELVHLIPFKELFKILLHAFGIIIIVKFGIDLLKINSTLFELTLSFLIFTLLLLLTSRIFSLNYLDSIKPLLNMNKSQAYLKNDTANV